MAKDEKSPAPEVEVVADQPTEDAAEQPKQEAVVIIKQVDEQGNISAVPLLDGVNPLEVETLLKLGLKKWQSQLGL